MVKSRYCILDKKDENECDYDLGGYFIAIGNEKVIIPQEILAANKIHIFKPTKNLGKR